LFSSFVELIEAILQVHHTPVVFSETPLNVWICIRTNLEQIPAQREEDAHLNFIIGSHDWFSSFRLIWTHYFIIETVQICIKYVNSTSHADEYQIGRNFRKMTGWGTIVFISIFGSYPNCCRLFDAPRSWAENRSLDSRFFLMIWSCSHGLEILLNDRSKLSIRLWMDNKKHPISKVIDDLLCQVPDT
jgi:hypothetical protein